MNKKRGQVTIFVIVAILIVVAVIAYFVFIGDGISSSGVEGVPETPSELVEQCLSRAIEEGIYFNSLQGGYFLRADDYVNYSFLTVPVYWSDGASKMPSIEVLEEQLEYAVRVSTILCVNDFAVFNGTYEVNSDSVESVEVSIDDGHVDARLIYPVYAKKGDTVTQFSEFRRGVDFDYKKYYDLVGEAMVLHEIFPNSIPISQFSELAYDNDFVYEVVEVSDTEQMYSFVFDMGEDPEYIYSFVGRYGN